MTLWNNHIKSALNITLLICYSFNFTLLTPVQLRCTFLCSKAASSMREIPLKVNRLRSIWQSVQGTPSTSILIDSNSLVSVSYKKYKLDITSVKHKVSQLICSTFSSHFYHQSSSSHHMPSRIRRFFNALFFVRKISSNKHGRRIFKYARDNRKRFTFSKFLKSSDFNSLALATTIEKN